MGWNILHLAQDHRPPSTAMELLLAQEALTHLIAPGPQTWGCVHTGQTVTRTGAQRSPEPAVGMARRDRTGVPPLQPITPKCLENGQEPGVGLLHPGAHAGVRWAGQVAVE